MTREEQGAEKQITATIKKAPALNVSRLEKRIRASLEKQPAEPWSEPLAREAVDVAEKTTGGKS